MFQRLLLIILLGLFMATTALADMPAALADQVAKLTVNDAAAGDRFGGSVALSGNNALVGAYNDDSSGRVDSGSAYLFERDEGGFGNWGRVAKLTASDAAADDLFGVSVALSGNTALVGAYGDDDGGSNSGSAYIFERDEGGPGNWGQVAKLTASDAAAVDQFGVSVALSGTTALVGAYYDDDGGSSSGSAYIFERDEGGAGNWGQVAKLTAADAAGGDQFGVSVALSGTTALIGSYLDDDLGIESGSAYLFERDEGGASNWGQVAKLTAAEVEAFDNFGWSVALSGTTALVGASNFVSAGLKGGVVRSGSAYVFERDEGGSDNWGQVARLTAVDAEAFDQFGDSVALSGTTALVGSLNDDDGGSNSGSAYVFERNEGGAGNWGQVAKLTAADAAPVDGFGGSVALSGTAALVGADGDDDSGSNSGSAYLFTALTGPVPLLQAPTAIPAAAAPVDVPVTLTGNGAGLAAIAFSIDYDETCLSFDPTDADMNGIPDAMVFNLAADFTPVVFFDLGDTDGEIDISIADVVPPFVSLADGDLVTLTFTATCTPVWPATAIAPVRFSSDPPASFSDDAAQDIAGIVDDGSVEVLSGTRGDCSANGVVNAADLVASVSELFDGDGSGWPEVVGGTFAGDPVGCDANADLVVDAGDLTCTNRLIFGGICDGGSARLPESVVSSPWLSLPESLVAQSGAVTVEVELSPGSHDLSAIVFSIDYDETRLSFDATDGNNDGIPDAVQFLGAPVSNQSAFFDASRSDAELSLLIADLIQNPRFLSEGALVRIELQVIGADTLLDGAVSFGRDPGASFGNAGGRSIPGGTVYGAGPFFADGFESGNTNAWSTP